MTPRTPLALLLSAALASPILHAQTPTGPAEDEPPTPQIVVEAPLPEGFPQPGPARRVLRKAYPAYRVARAEGPDPFGLLFRHIQKHDIPMTAPVEMTFEDDPADDGRPPRTSTMMFMYASAEVGDLGRDGPVEVVDLPALDVLSYGFFGPMDDTHLDAARAELDRTLAADPTLEPVGPVRVMGYNSPFVPAPQRYTEVQRPVKDKHRETDAE